MAYASILGCRAHQSPQFPDIPGHMSLRGAYGDMSAVVDQIEQDIETNPKNVASQAYREHLERALKSNGNLHGDCHEKLLRHSAIIGICREIISPRNKIQKQSSKLEILYLKAIISYSNQFEERINSVMKKLDSFVATPISSSSSSVSEPTPDAKPLKTRVTVHFNAKSGEKLFIRGNRAGLTWDRGVAMKREGKDKWSFTTTEPFSKQLKFKFLLNDKIWEKKTENHHLESGKKWDFRHIHF